MKRSNVEFAGEITMTIKTHLLLLANAKVLSV
jgi:hypothetical protein